jgi:hypothetical protein
VATCLVPPRAGIESVEVVRGARPYDHQADKLLTIDGKSAERRLTTCHPLKPRAPVNPARISCAASIYFPADRVAFTVRSTTGAAEVDALLGRVHHLPHLVGVPASREVLIREQERSGAAYLRALRKDGFRPKVLRRRERGMRPGYVLSTTPAAGTMRPAGTQVIVTISRG